MFGAIGILTFSLAIVAVSVILFLPHGSLRTSPRIIKISDTTVSYNLGTCPARYIQFAHKHPVTIATCSYHWVSQVKVGDRLTYQRGIAGGTRYIGYVK